MLFLTPRTGPLEKHSPIPAASQVLARVLSITSVLPAGRTCTPGRREWRSQTIHPGVPLPCCHYPMAQPQNRSERASSRQPDAVSSPRVIRFLLPYPSSFMERHRWIDSTRSPCLVQGHSCTGTEVLFPYRAKFMRCVHSHSRFVSCAASSSARHSRAALTVARKVNH